MVKEIFSFSRRNVFKNKTFFLINVIGLSIGMTSIILILLWVQNELSFDQYEPRVKDIYRAGWTNAEKTYSWDGSPYNFSTIACANLPEIELSTRLLNSKRDRLIFAVNGILYAESHTAYVDSNWFRIFQYQLVDGKLDKLDFQSRIVIISESVSLKYFGTRLSAGKNILVDNQAFTVAAVIHEPPPNSSFQFNMFLPAELHYGGRGVESKPSWTSFDWQTFFLFKPRTDKWRAGNKLAALLTKYSATQQYSILTRLDELHFDTEIQSADISQGSKRVVWIFISLGALLLIISCVNYINFVTASAIQRTKEIAIRKVNGASRMALFAQFMIETAMTNLFSLGLTVLLVALAIPHFNLFLENDFAFALLSKQVYVAVALTFLVSTLITGIYPALLLSSVDAKSILRKTSLFFLKGSSLRKGLVATQFVISISLIISTIVISRQLHFINSESNTYDRSQIISIPLDAKRIDTINLKTKTALLDYTKSQIERQPEIEGVTFASESIINMNISMQGIASWKGKPEGFEPLIYPLWADADFDQVFHLKLKEGRWFSDKSNEDVHNYVLNETAVKELGIKSPVIGQGLILIGDTGRIIGVVNDFHFRSLREKIGSMVIANKPESRRTLFVRVKVSDAQKTLTTLGDRWKEWFPGDPFTYQFLDESYNRLYRSEIKSSMLINFFSFVAVLLTCMGVYGLSAFAAERRLKEIGVRKVLGASISNLVFMLSGSFVRLVIWACAIAFPIAAFAMSKWLRNFQYRISLDWWIFAIAGAVVLCLTFITISFKAYTAARENPVKSLRTEF